MSIAVHTNLYYDDGTVIATDVHSTEVDNASTYTATLANASGAAYASTLVYDADGFAIINASYDGQWVSVE